VSTLRSLLVRDRTVVLSAIGVLAALSWLSMLRHAAGMNAATVLRPHAHVHDAAASGLGVVFLMWMAMMVAMMLPPVTPWIVFHARLARERGGVGSPFPSTLAFVAGYFTVWGAFSLAAAIAHVALRNASVLAPRELVIAPAAGGVLLVLAGAFQLSPLKSACLAHCRSPLSFFVAEWRDGPTGACGMGLRHGAYCVACCWALMVLSFALGVMNLWWMGLLTLFLCLEKIAPHGARISRLSGILLIAWGAWLWMAGA